MVDIVRNFSLAPCWRSPMWRSQAEAKGLTLLKADNTAGYLGVRLSKPGTPKPYKAQVWRGGTMAHLGYFATAEEAALCIARSPEGRAAAKKAAASEEGNAPAMPPGATLKEEGAVPPMPPDAYVKEEVAPIPPGAFVKEEVVVKRELEVVVDEGGRSKGRPKRRRNA